MNWDISRFLTLNGFIVTLIVISIVMLRRSARKPTKLKMKTNPGALYTPSAKQRVIELEAKDLQASHLELVKATMEADSSKVDKDPSSAGVAKARPLNVMFNYNGYSWDAYEVLGVPAGSSLLSVQEAYETMKKSMDRESQHFVDAAYQALMKVM